MHTVGCTHRTIVRVGAFDRCDLEASSRYPWYVSMTVEKILEGSEVKTFGEKHRKMWFRHETLARFFWISLKSCADHFSFDIK